MFCRFVPELIIHTLDFCSRVPATLSGPGSDLESSGQFVDSCKNFFNSRKCAKDWCTDRIVVVIFVVIGHLSPSTLSTLSLARHCH